MKNNEDKLEHDGMFRLGSSKAMSPLADPVVSAVFANVGVAGLAVQSLIGAVLESDEDAVPIDRIVSVTPQRAHVDPTVRGCRVDIETMTQADEYIMFEIQINPDMTIMQRDLFDASNIFTRTSRKGDSPQEMASRLPRAVYINILKYNIREDNKDMVQPFKVLYTKPPQTVAVKNFSGYNVQLPRVQEMPEDFTNRLYCWCYTLMTAHEKGISIEEVVKMKPGLQTYADTDSGFKQFCTQYQLASSDPNVWNEYVLWVKDLMREQGVYETGRADEAKQWQQVVEAKDAELADKDAALADKNAALADKDAALADKDAALADKDAALADKDAVIAELKKRLGVS